MPSKEMMDRLEDTQKFPFLLSKEVRENLAIFSYVSLRTLYYLLFVRDKLNEEDEEKIRNSIPLIDTYSEILIFNGVVFSSKAVAVFLDAEEIAKSKERKEIIISDLKEAIESNYKNEIPVFFLTPKEEVRYIFHEVGHLIVNMHITKRVNLGVSVIPGEGFDGINLIWDSTVKNSTIEDLFKHIVVCIAGGEAALLLEPGTDAKYIGCDSDFRSINLCINRILDRYFFNSIDGVNIEKYIPQKYQKSDYKNNSDENEDNFYEFLNRVTGKYDLSYQDDLNYDYLVYEVINEKLLNNYQIQDYRRFEYYAEIFLRAVAIARGIIISNFKEFGDLCRLVIEKKVLTREDIKKFYDEHEEYKKICFCIDKPI